MAGSRKHGPSIKNPATYTALRKAGMPKSKAAAVSNGALKSGAKKGVHHKGKKT